MDLALRYLARRDRTVAQVEQFLRHHGASPSRTKQVIDRLSDLRYLDDRAYAQRWIESRLARRTMGRAGLKAELQARGIPETVEEEAVGRALQGVDEDSLARRALKTTPRRGRRCTPAQAARLLRRRGFEEDTIDRIMGLRDESD
jgi:regulatory protein